MSVRGKVCDRLAYTTRSTEHWEPGGPCGGCESTRGVDGATETHRPTLFGRDVFVPFFVSCLVSDALVAVMAVGGRPSSAARRLPALGRSLVHRRSLRHGYWATSMGLHHHLQTPWPFFPMLPMAMRVVSFSGISVPLAGILLNHARVPRSASWACTGSRFVTDRRGPHGSPRGSPRSARSRSCSR